MLGAMIAFGIGMLLIFLDWRMSTPPDPKTHRRPPLSPTDRRRLRDMFFWSIGVAVAVYFLPMLF